MVIDSVNPDALRAAILALPWDTCPLCHQPNQEIKRGWLHLSRVCAACHQEASDALERAWRVSLGAQAASFDWSDDLNN